MPTYEGAMPFIVYAIYQISPDYKSFVLSF